MWAVAGVAASGGCTTLLGVDEDWHGAETAGTGAASSTGGASELSPSCSGLPSTCGLGAHESCCASSVVTGGTYHRSNDPAYPATVSDFRLDRFEITVGRFRQFVASYPGSKPAAGAGAHPLIAGSGWQANWDPDLAASQSALTAGLKCDPTYVTWTDSVGGNENKPMNCLDWYEAFAFCAWDGGRLATEAEWNYAAAGGANQYMYPWGDAAADDAHAVYYCQADGSAPAACAVTDLVNVGARSPKGDGRWGQADLAGSMNEWTLDWAVEPYAASVCSDCAAVTKGTASLRIYRGGGFALDESGLKSSVRLGGEPTQRTIDFGARCVRTR